jgi:acetyl/propionyl-CoA carboxylase alpha subunit
MEFHLLRLGLPIHLVASVGVGVAGQLEVAAGDTLEVKAAPLLIGKAVEEEVRTTGEESTKLVPSTLSGKIACLDPPPRDTLRGTCPWMDR